MVITDLTGTTWILNNTIMPFISGITDFSVNFLANHNQYGKLVYNTEATSFIDTTGAESLILVDNLSTELESAALDEIKDQLVFLNNQSQTIVYNFNDDTWVDDKERTIKILSGTDVTNIALITWLQENAILVETEALPKDLITFEALKALRDQLVRFNLGFVGGVWSSVLKYTTGDIVYYNKRLYKCITEAPIGTLPTNNTYWLKLEFIQYEYVTTKDDSFVTTNEDYAVVLSEGE